MADDRLFVGLFPGGVCYADRTVEEHGDFKSLAFLPYGALKLEIRKGCPADLRKEIEEHAAVIVARRGEQFIISECGQYVVLGEAR